MFLPLDIIHSCICPYLSLDDLRDSMLVCKEWFFTMIADGAFAHFKTKVLSMNPELQILFTTHPWEFGDERTAQSMRPSKGKKQRKEWITPRGGTWYILKHYIDKARTIAGWRTLHKMKDPLARTTLVAAAKRMIKPANFDTNVRFESDPHHSGHFRIFFDNFISIHCGYDIVIRSLMPAIRYTKPWKPMSAFNNCLSLFNRRSFIRRGMRFWYNYYDGRIKRIGK